MLHPVIASREVTRYILDTFGLHTKKRFGQNFLINESVVRGIAEKAKIGPGDLVLEVGPGIGTLTQALAETGADIKSVEIDESLLPILRKTLEGYDMGISLRLTSKTLRGESLLQWRRTCLITLRRPSSFPCLKQTFP